MDEDRWWERNCRKCGHPFAGTWAPTPLGWMHRECAAQPVRPPAPPPEPTLARLTHRPATLPIGPVVWIDGDYEVDVVGESYRFDNFQRVVGPPRADGYAELRHALLVPELTNPHDPLALSVLIHAELVGYFPRVDKTWANIVLHLMAMFALPVACWSIVSGGFMTRSGKPADYSVRLLLPPVDGPTDDDILGALSYRLLDEGPRRVVLLLGDEEVDAVGESEFQDALEAIAGGRCAEGHARDVMAELHVRPGRGDVTVVMDGKDVGYLRRGDLLWRRICQAVARSHRRPAACSAKITGGKGGAGVRKTQFQVKLRLPVLPMRIVDPGMGLM